MPRERAREGAGLRAGKRRDGKEGKGELFRFLTTSERRRLVLSARPTRDSCVCSALVFFPSLSRRYTEAEEV